MADVVQSNGGSMNVTHDGKKRMSGDTKRHRDRMSFAERNMGIMTIGGLFVLASKKILPVDCECCECSM